MSKMDDLRKMREARYEQAAARAAKANGAKPGAAKPAAKPAVAPTTAKRPTKKAATGSAASEATVEGREDALCGHRSMNGRTCTREQGHSAKSHRYS